MAKDSTKTDAMRKMREQRFSEQRQKPKEEDVIDVTTPWVRDPSGRGGRSKIKVPRRDAKVEPREDYPAPSTEQGEGRCTGCGKIRAVRNGLVISHSWPPPTRQVCPGSRKPPAK